MKLTEKKLTFNKEKMSKKYTFLEALEIVSKTKAKIKYKNIPGIILHSDHYSAYLSYPGCNKWCPTLEQQNQKKWEVEPDEVFVWWDGINFEFKPPLYSGYKKYKLVEVIE